jgi:hypothetical protein
MFVLGLFLGTKSGKLDGQLMYLLRIRAAFQELKRIRIRDEKEHAYWQGYFHGIVHISEGKPPDNLRVDNLIAEIE